MTSSIQRFKSSFKYDPAKQNRFDVIIIPPTNLPFIGVSSRDLAFKCQTAELPGRTMATTEQKTYGPIEKFPYLTMFNDIDLTFIIEDDMRHKRFFDNWLNYISPLSTNNYKYKSDYCCDIVINQYDLTDKLSYSVRLIESFPLSVNQLSLDWSSDDYHKLTVTFAYTRWEPNSTILYANV
jgi:hypothetical protein